MAPKPSARQTAAKASSVSSKQPQKSTPAKKQPLPPADRLKRLFTSLCAQIDGGYFANAVKTCDRNPKDEDALQTKLFLLLQTEQYIQALTLISNVNDQNEQEEEEGAFFFEKGYTLHRLHREEDATEVLKVLKEGGSEDENRGVAHLEAQLAYREGDYQTAYDLYNTLLDTAEPHSDEQADILTNLSAAQAHLDFLTSGFLTSLAALPQPITDSLETSPPPSQVVSSVPSAAAHASAPQTEAQQKKLRTRRIPKSVVPGVTPPPDPERWLKKSERSSYLQAHARRRRGGGGATQGVVETPGASGGGGAGGAGKGKKKGKK
ncbi:hypothetical protein C8Q72DRAFT_557249 [Fomitopsis betulina]|nr:hypothetical protein C8Q72DRAFT_557249 [Fomitopsis betulina]